MAERTDLELADARNWARFHHAVRDAANAALAGYADLPNGPHKAWAWDVLAALTDACHDLDETAQLNTLMLLEVDLATDDD